jgi:hypothetical protein
MPHVQPQQRACVLNSHVVIPVELYQHTAYRYAALYTRNTTECFVYTSCAPYGCSGAVDTDSCGPVANKTMLADSRQTLNHRDLRFTGLSVLCSASRALGHLWLCSP